MLSEVPTWNHRLLSSEQMLADLGLPSKQVETDTLRNCHRRLLEAIDLDPSNQHARDSLASVCMLAGQLGVSLE
jgi:hypothetical protein